MAHCSKSSFFVQNSTLISRENCRFFWGEKLVKMLGFCQNWIFGQKVDFWNSVIGGAKILETNLDSLWLKKNPVVIWILAWKLIWFMLHHFWCENSKFLLYFKNCSDAIVELQHFLPPRFFWTSNICTDISESKSLFVPLPVERFQLISYQLILFYKKAYLVHSVWKSTKKSSKLSRKSWLK